jgi:hypothetical protein
MSVSSHSISNGLSISELEDAFLALLPRIELHGRIYFRHIKCPHEKGDDIQEMRALGWKWLVRLHERGKDPEDFVRAFVTYLAHAVNSGRRLAGKAKARDVLNPICQKRCGFKVENLPGSFRAGQEYLYASPRGQQLQDEMEERLQDNTITPVFDQVQFRIDFRAWLKTLTPRERRMVRGMMRNERTKDLSKRFEVTAGRISQMRREFHDSWQRFCSDAGQADPALA